MKSFEENYKKWHTNISFAKSGIRLIGCALALLFVSNLTVAIVALSLSLAIAEVLGIAEEWI